MTQGVTANHSLLSSNLKIGKDILDIDKYSVAGDGISISAMLVVFWFSISEISFRQFGQSV
jgi:hypothetical protein